MRLHKADKLKEKLTGMTISNIEQVFGEKFVFNFSNGQRLEISNETFPSLYIDGRPCGLYKMLVFKIDGVIVSPV